MSTHSSILAWKIPWTEEPGGLQSMRSQRVGHEEVTKHSTTQQRLYLQIRSYSWVQFSSVNLLSRVRLFATPWTATCQASLSITSSWSLLKLLSIESVMSSNHLIFCHPLLLPPSIFHSIKVFSNESVLCIRWPKHWSFSFSISPSNEYSGLIYFRID